MSFKYSPFKYAVILGTVCVSQDWSVSFCLGFCFLQFPSLLEHTKTVIMSLVLDLMPFPSLAFAFCTYKSCINVVLHLDVLLSTMTLYDFYMTILQQSYLETISRQFSSLYIHLQIGPAQFNRPSTTQLQVQDLSRYPTTLQSVSYAIYWKNIWMPAVSLCNDGGKDSW